MLLQEIRRRDDRAAVCERGDQQQRAAAEPRVSRGEPPRDAPPAAGLRQARPRHRPRQPRPERLPGHRPQPRQHPHHQHRVQVLGTI